MKVSRLNQKTNCLNVRIQCQFSQNKKDNNKIDLTRSEINFCAYSSIFIAISILLEASLFVKTAFAATFEPLPAGTSIGFDVILKNNKVGTLFAQTFPLLDNFNRMGIQAEFTTSTGESYNDFLSKTLGGAIGINWLQFLDIEPDNQKPPQILGDPSIDPIAGGLGGSWADNKPWYWHTTQPNNLAQGTPDPGNPGGIILPNGKKYDPNFSVDAQLIRATSGISDSFLQFEDYPGGPAFPDQTILNFSTFLVAEFPGKTYDTLAGFTWTARVDQEIENNKPVTYTDILSLKPGALFTPEYANLVSAFGGAGYTKALKLPTYKYSRTLSPGKVQKIDITGLPTSPINSDGFPTNSIYYSTRIKIFDPDSPYVGLGAFNSSGQPTDLYVANADGTIHLKVSDIYDYDFDGKVSKGGICTEYGEYGQNGGEFICVKWEEIHEELHSTSSQYNLLVKLYESPSLHYAFYPANSSISRLSFFSTPNESLVDRKTTLSSNERVPEPTSVLGLLTLGAGGILAGLTNRKARTQ